MTSELRPAVEVWRKAVYDYGGASIEGTEAEYRAAAVIEADRQAVRAEQAAELAKRKALAETLAGALEAIRSEAQREEGSWLHLKRCIAAQSAQTLTSYKEQRDV